MNIYHGEKKPIITANCAVVKSANHPIENGGMLHVTDAILPQVTKTIRDILIENKDFGKFTECMFVFQLRELILIRRYVRLIMRIFHAVAANAEILEKLGEPGNYTVFAATDAAFDELSEDLKTKLKKGKSCIKSNYSYMHYTIFALNGLVV